MKSNLKPVKQASSVLCKIHITVLLVCLINLMGFLTAKCQNSSRPNILVILLDDARYDSFGPNGGPAFFNTPSINSIAAEGVNFKSSFVTTAVCGPSRASIYTGLYTHNHGCWENGDSPHGGLTYVSSILQDAGYYTGFIGKWLFNYKVADRPVGFDYWAITDSFKHIDPVVEFNDGSEVEYVGHDSKIFTDLATDFWNNKAPNGQPWLLFMSHRVPHTPYQPEGTDDQLYDDDMKPFPSNFNYYQKNFPSYLYPNKEFIGDSTALVQEIEDYFETCYSAETSTDSLLTYLSNHHLLDNTLILFTSDNGYFFGEHKLTMKLLAYEQAMRVPLFIRYPAWFAPGTVIENEIAANIDIAPTLLEAAGITDTFHMDGVSLHSLATLTHHRPYLFFEQIPSIGTSWEAVRSNQYKYIFSYCSDQTEEFYDLVNDPHENTNLIFDTTYSSLIQQYRQLRDSLRIATGDTVFPSTTDCNLYSMFYADADKDGFGNKSIWMEKHTQPSGYVIDKTDCNDANKKIHPGASDICNTLDDNCNTLIDENAITANITPAGSVSICPDVEITLIANTGTGITFQWLKDNKKISGATNANYTTLKKAGYQVVETNSFSCTDTSLVTSVSELSKPSATINALGNLNICTTGSVTLQANSGTGLTYQWQKGGTNISGATNQSYIATKAGSYKVVVTNSSGCSKTSSGISVSKTCKVESTAEKITASTFTVYPNPTNGQFTVHLYFEGAEENEITSIEVMNVVGQLVYAEKASTEEGTLTKEIVLDHSLSNGIYMVRVMAKDKIYSSQIFYQK